jgi:uncharacterized membrane protein
MPFIERALATRPVGLAASRIVRKNRGHRFWRAIMDWYAIFKFLHVVAAICWIGGGAVLMYQGVLAGRAKDDDAQMVVVKQTAGLALNWFMPAAMSTLVFGIVTATLGGMWSDAWVILGLVGFAATFVTGNFVIRPTADAIAKAESEGKRADALAAARKMTQVAKFDYVMLFTVIADMVFKPQWSDIALLVIMAAVLVAGAALFLVPALQRTAAA